MDSSWIRNPSDELALAEGCTFEESQGRFVCDFLERFCRQSKGRWAGKALVLMPWQVDFLVRLYGWRRKDGSRRFRTAYLEVPKKQGKTTMLSGLGLYHLVADGEAAAECAICAVDSSQAGIMFDEAARMVRKSPDLASRLEVIPSRQVIVHAAEDGKLEALSADVPSKDGLNLSLVIFDELHRQKTDAMYNILKYAGVNRDQPMHIDITTAGEDELGIWHERRVYSEQVAEGAIPDISHLGMIYRALPTDDFDDPAVWYKANPSMGLTIREDDFRRELIEAKASPRKWANFLRLRLGIVVNETARFLDPNRWAACSGPDTDHLLLLRRLLNRPCYGGLDLSSTTDLTAYVLIFPDDHGNYDVLVRCWIPEESASTREREDNVPYRVWRDRGYLEFTPGDVVDYAYVEEAIERDAERFELVKLFSDPYNATKLCLDLQSKGIPVEFLRQGFLSLSGPTKELERLVLSKKIRHGNHPVLNWCALNAVTEQDAAGNLKLSKRRSREKIDLMAALVNAVAAASAGDEFGATCDTRGVVWV